MAGHDNVIKLLVEHYGKVPVSMVTVLVCFEDDCSVCVAVAGGSSLGCTHTACLHMRSEYSQGRRILRINCSTASRAHPVDSICHSQKWICRKC